MMKGICKNCNIEFTREWIDRKRNKNIFCSLICAGKYNSSIKSNLQNIVSIDYSNGKKCPNCNVIKPILEFYKNSRNPKLPTSHCKKCLDSNTMKRQKKFKIQCVKYKGGKCIICNYFTCINALEFHHINPSKKDFNLSNQKSTKFNKKIQEELDKCILLCANCHREVHAGIINLDGI